MSYQFQKLRNMWKEFKRLNGFMFTAEHNRAIWNINAPSEHGRYLISSEGSHLLDENGNIMVMPTDRFDQVYAFVSNFIATYVNNIFIIERCSHPHEHIYASYEGDSDMGYVIQCECMKCGGYVNETNIDRYLPENQRHPELVKLPFKPYGYNEYDETEFYDGKGFSDSPADEMDYAA